MDDLEQPMNRQEEMYCSALGRNQMRLWDVPEKVRRGTACQSLYVVAFRYARDSGGGIRRFLEDFDFLHKELWNAEDEEQYEHLSSAYEYMTENGQWLYGLHDFPDKPPYWSLPMSRIALEELKHSTLPKKLGLSPKQFEQLSLNPEFLEEILKITAKIARKYLAQND